MNDDWAALYGDLMARLPGLAAGAPLTLCGMGACVDARVSLHDIGPMLQAEQPVAAAFARTLQGRAQRGQGGEMLVDWADGPDWIIGHLPVAYAMGGTGPHAAWTLTTVGAPALLALEDRSALMLGLAPPAILLAEEDDLVTAGSAARHGQARSFVFIFEYTAGRPIGDVVPTRSSRIIVRFGAFLLEHDESFARLSRSRAATAGSGLVAGFSSVEAVDLEREAGYAMGLVRDWRAAGLATVHLELAGYATMDLLHTTLRAARGVVTSVGMSLSELHAIEGDGQDLFDTMRGFGDRLAVDRVCIHADDWAATVTRSDPTVERDALLTGCLLAGSRAAAGHPVLPEVLASDAQFSPLPFVSDRRAEGWTFVACASPFVKAPKTTLGLGDTFTGGCLLALGAASGAASTVPSL